MIRVDVAVIGAGAAGLMCAWQAGRRGRGTLLLDQAEKPGKKILISGGGRCNFTNRDVSSENYISANPRFCKSALSRFTQCDFLELVEKRGIPYHEREHGQLFCDREARDILDLLLAGCRENQVKQKYNIRVSDIERDAEGGYRLKAGSEEVSCDSLVIATGGLSIPKMGAGPFGYRVAEEFGLKIQPTRAGLVPFTLRPEDKWRFAELSGIAVRARVKNDRAEFLENILFTHRGLSGPAILQISSYWRPGETVTIDVLPEKTIAELFAEARKTEPRRMVKSILAHSLPRRVISALLDDALLETQASALSPRQIDEIAAGLKSWKIQPEGTEGYRTAEVTVGGVDCDELSSRTMEARRSPGLYFIGEVMDVTGWLGGYNLQWAWSSGYCAGQFV